MTAADQIVRNVKKVLARGGRPHMGACDGRSRLEGVRAACGRLRVRRKDAARRRSPNSFPTSRAYLKSTATPPTSRWPSDQGKATNGRMCLAFCVAHARRKFVGIQNDQSPFAREVIERMGEVYATEKRVRGTSADNRRAVRQAETKPIMEALHARLVAVKDGISRISPLRETIDYTLGHWAGLTLFLEDGRLEPDSNIVERSIRPIAIGKKNSLFCGDAGGGETWAIISSRNWGKFPGERRLVYAGAGRMRLARGGILGPGMPRRSPMKS